VMGILTLWTGPEIAIETCFPKAMDTVCGDFNSRVTAIVIAVVPKEAHGRMYKV
jgi:hypothetical protein